MYKQVNNELIQTWNASAVYTQMGKKLFPTPTALRHGGNVKINI